VRGLRSPQRLPYLPQQLQLCTVAHSAGVAVKNGHGPWSRAPVLSEHDRNTFATSITAMAGRHSVPAPLLASRLPCGLRPALRVLTRSLFITCGAGPGGRVGVGRRAEHAPLDPQRTPGRRGRVALSDAQLAEPWGERCIGAAAHLGAAGAPQGAPGRGLGPQRAAPRRASARLRGGHGAVGAHDLLPPCRAHAACLLLRVAAAGPSQPASCRVHSEETEDDALPHVPRLPERGRCHSGQEAPARAHAAPARLRPSMYVPRGCPCASANEGSPCPLRAC
jgi:hypothetical protein